MVYENQTVVAPWIVSKLSSKVIVHAIVSVLYFYSTQISIIYNFAWNERFCLPLGKVKIGLY